MSGKIRGGYTGNPASGGPPTGGLPKAAATAPTGLLAPALRDCVAAMQALEACDAIRPPEDWWAAIRAAREKCVEARAKAEAALALFDARTPASAWD